MHNLFETLFPKQMNPGTTHTYSVDHTQTAAPEFELSDADAQMVVSSGDGVFLCKNEPCLNVHIINYEAYVNQYKKGAIANSKRCDFVLYDQEKQHFLIAELTHCMQNSLTRAVSEKHPETKEEYAMLKFQDTITSLCTVEKMRAFIMEYTTKSCVFACRLIETGTCDFAVNAMANFLKPVQVIGTIIRSDFLSISGINFRYVRCIYPDPYVFCD